MSVILKTTSVKPFLQMSTAEQDNIVSLMETALINKTVLVLGSKHCFFCGAELGEVIDKSRYGKGDHLLYINTCDVCLDLVPFK